uniref:Uncharacterized protein n=1 Tax=Rhizophora mucronata TaxID=61149 RepID=A0A2P2QYZ5_RHIMU
MSFSLYDHYSLPSWILKV